jgi:hypothetical protein
MRPAAKLLGEMKLGGDHWPSRILTVMMPPPPAPLKGANPERMALKMTAEASALVSTG